MTTKFIKIVAVVTIALNFIACSFITPAATPTAADMDQEEQAVYSFFIYTDGGAAVILQDTSTGMSIDDPKQLLNNIKSSFPDASRQTLDSFMQRNAQPSQISPDMQLGMDYVLLSADELSAISSQPNWGDVFNEKYPNSKGYTIFSRVGFNNTLDQAVVYVGRVAGPMMGSGSYYFLEKKNNEWILKDEMEAWIM